MTALPSAPAPWARLAPLPSLVVSVGLLVAMVLRPLGALEGIGLLTAPFVLGLGLLGWLAPELRRSPRPALRRLGRLTGVGVLLVQAVVLWALVVLSLVGPDWVAPVVVGVTTLAGAFLLARWW